MSRIIVLDTETTGLSPEHGHRLVEIGCIELIAMTPTMNTYHKYINPQRDMPPQAQAVHGLSAEFLKSHPTFEQIAAEFYHFLQDATLVIHNASFDLSFINYEFKKLNFAPLTNKVVDTLKLARELYPGKRASLDALCSKFNINLNEREAKGHGALLDAKLLTQVYLKMITQNLGEEISFATQSKTVAQAQFQSSVKANCSITEEALHQEFCQELLK